ncbi:MAG: peptidylprolyl isomerase [Phycisphaerales bacterium]|nr:peptidylprolyl isomerase [Phycisphaerales bacterium]
MSSSVHLLFLATATLASLLGCAQSRTPAPTHLAYDRSSIVVLVQTSAGDITLELDPVNAPISVGNFLNHAAKGDYDGTVFHRVIPTFVIQGGGWTFDPATKMLADRGKAEKDAGRPDGTIINEWRNGLKNVRGTIAWARESDPDTATREFYINVADNPKLDTAREKTGNAGYAVFGRVVAGMDVVDAIKSGRTEARPDIVSDGEGLKDVPVEPVTVLRIIRE